MKIVMQKYTTICLTENNLNAKFMSPEHKMKAIFTQNVTNVLYYKIIVVKHH